VIRWTNAVPVVLLALFISGCAAPQTAGTQMSPEEMREQIAMLESRLEDLQDQVGVLQVLRTYEMAVATYDSQAAMDLFTDEYEGWRGGGKEGIGRMVDMMAERNGSYEFDLTDSVVTVEGDTATVEGVVALMGRWNMRSTYVLVRTGDGWKISDVQFQR
jgi:ketosteroid isomerase-like protein